MFPTGSELLFISSARAGARISTPERVNLAHSGAERERQSLVIFFDKHKVVHNYIMCISEG